MVKTNKEKVHATNTPLKKASELNKDNISFAKGLIVIFVIAIIILILHFAGII